MSQVEQPTASGDFPDEEPLRQQMVAIAAKMYARDYIAGIAGNLSARLPGGRLLFTPAGAFKADLRPEQLLVLDENGNPLDALPGSRPSSELPMHLEVYRQRKDVGAVIHAHPVACVALSLVGIPLDQPIIPEALVMLGRVPTVPYATPSSEENREAIAGLVGAHNALILAHHGSLTFGRDLQEAYIRLETLEHSARTLALAHRLGQPQHLTPEAIRKLNQVFSLK